MPTLTLVWSESDTMVLRLQWVSLVEAGCTPKNKGFEDTQWVCIPILSLCGLKHIA